MRRFDDLTDALRHILVHFTRGYTVWIAFQVDVSKLNTIDGKWADNFGTRLPAWKKQDRKAKGLANAVAISSPVLSLPSQRMLMLMATEHALNMPEASPWAREKWLTRLPELSDFVIVHEPRERGDYAWTWRLQQRVAGGLERYLVKLIREGDASRVKYETCHWARLYPMFGGVRRQLRRILNSGRKLWKAMYPNADWPGQDPDNLPAMVGFRKIIKDD